MERFHNEYRDLDIEQYVQIKGSSYLASTSFTGLTSVLSLVSDLMTGLLTLNCCSFNGDPPKDSAPSSELTLA